MLNSLTGSMRKMEAVKFISLVTPKIKNSANVDVPTAAATVKHPAATQMNLKPCVYASRNPPRPAPMICPVTPGIFPRAAVFWLFRAVMKSGRDDMGRPRGRTAAAILGPRFVFSLPTRMALSVNMLAVGLGGGGDVSGELTDSQTDGTAERANRDHKPRCRCDELTGSRQLCHCNECAETCSQPNTQEDGVSPYVSTARWA